jgi:hypothetical protein
MPFFELKRFWCTTKWRDFLRRNTKQFYAINTVFTSQMNIKKCYPWPKNAFPYINLEAQTYWVAVLFAFFYESFQRAKTSHLLDQGDLS